MLNELNNYSPFPLTRHSNTCPCFQVGVSISKAIDYTLLVISLPFVFLSGCGSNEPPPNGNNKPSWYINWSQTPNNSLDVQGGGPDVWKSVLEQETNYSVSTFRQTAIQQEPSLNWNLPSSFENFVTLYYQENGLDQYPLDQNSFLFGIGTPMNTPEDVYGRTLYRGLIGSPSFAVSFVFKSKTDTLTFPDTTNTYGKRQWAITQFTIHECGHARGLNWGLPENPEYEHTNHGGEGSTDCVMRNIDPGNLLTAHVFCEKHQKILRLCLTEIKGSYNAADPCASYN